jgi:hypothetical protein
MLQEMAAMDALSVQERCLFCDWSFSGTVAEGRENAAQHRAEAHPDAIWRKRKKGKDSHKWVQYRPKEQIADAYEERKRRAFLLGIDLPDPVAVE